MAEYRKRRTRAEMIVHLGGVCLGLLAFAFVAGAAVLGAWHMYTRLTDASDGDQAAKQQLALVEAQKNKIEEDIAELNTERGQEAAVRERYGVVKPGEGVIQIVQTPQASSTGASAATGGFFSRIFHALFDW